MNLFTFLRHKLPNFFSFKKRRIISDLTTVFGEEDTPATDPNRGTTFWTANRGGKLQKRFEFLIGIAIIIAIIFIYQLWQLQIVQGEALAIESQQNTLAQTPLFAQRGIILDRNERRLAWNTNSSSSPFFPRSYASSSGFGHLLGYISYPQQDDKGFFYEYDTRGRDGVEKHFQRILSGQIGTKIVETNALGSVISESVVRQPRSGSDLRLSIDAEVQEKMYELIKRTAEERGFAAGAGVIMDVHTGELLAATDYPEYSSQKLTEGDQDYIDSLSADVGKPFLNRISSGRFTPGSAIKPFIALAALAEGVISPRTTIVSTGVLRVENPYQPGTYSLFPDWKEHGSVDVRDAIAVSSNEFFYQIGGGYKSQPGLGITNIAAYSHAFKLADKTGIEGMNEVAGVIPTPAWKKANFADDIWRLGDTYHTAIGQYGYQVTPLAMVRGVAGIATDGKLPVPNLLYGKRSGSEEVTKDISASDYRVVREGMRQAVTDGTAKGLNVDYLQVAAKTGTAELGGKETGLNSWVIGFFPYDNPQYAFTVVMADGPRSNTVGGVYVIRRLLDWMYLSYPDYLP
jgi:penicillin-binding protein 2